MKCPSPMLHLDPTPSLKVTLCCPLYGLLQRRHRAFTVSINHWKKHVFYGLFWYVGLNFNSCAKNIAKISCQNYRSFTTSLRSKFSLQNKIAEFMIELNIFLIRICLFSLFCNVFDQNGIQRLDICKINYWLKKKHKMSKNVVIFTYCVTQADEV